MVQFQPAQQGGQWRVRDAEGRPTRSAPGLTKLPSRELAPMLLGGGLHTEVSEWL